ncbi:Ca2+-binding RTX toxin-like protein [Bradyrhizobium sp. USDA 4518]
MVDVAANTSTTARLETSDFGLSVGGSYSGVIDFAGDHDWIAVTLNAGTAYRFYGSGSSTDGTTDDTVLELHNAAGTLLVSNDDSGVGLNPFLTYTPATTGTYFIDMHLFSTTNPSGEYSVFVSSASATDVQLTTGADTVTSPATFSDRELGGAGNDSISLGASTGTQGYDALGEQGADILHGNATANYLVGGIGNDSIFGHGGNDAMWGDGGNDSLDGGDGNDELFGGPGNDIMTGGTGNDIFHVDSIGDTVVELANGGTADEVRTALNNYVLAPQVENLKLEGGTAALNATGNELNNSMTGNLGNNTLSGGGGNDTLIGGQGNDVLIGGAGKDTTTGGGGLDRMVISSLSDSGTTFAQRDVINTFAHGDKIDLTGIDANSNVAGNQAFQFVDNFSHVAGQLQWDLTGVSATGVKGYLVQGDVNGDAIADFSLQIYTSPTANLPGGVDGWHLAAFDFIL